jgi:hypothetical protein
MAGCYLVIPTRAGRFSSCRFGVQPPARRGVEHQTGMVSATALRYGGASFDMSTRAISVTASAWALALGLFAISNVAAAAPPPTVGGGGAGPEQEACAGRSVGDACTLPNQALGTCGQGVCNRLDYSQGSPPKAIEEPCVVCKPSQGHDGGPPLGTTTTTETSPTEDSAATGAAAGEGAGSKEPPKSESRCTIDTERRLGGREPVGFAGLAVLLLLACVRRRSA